MRRGGTARSPRRPRCPALERRQRAPERERLEGRPLGRGQERGRLAAEVEMRAERVVVGEGRDVVPAVAAAQQLERLHARLRDGDARIVRHRGDDAPRIHVVTGEDADVGHAERRADHAADHREAVVEHEVGSERRHLRDELRAEPPRPRDVADGQRPGAGVGALERVGREHVDERRAARLRPLARSACRCTPAPRPPRRPAPASPCARARSGWRPTWRRRPPSPQLQLPHQRVHPREVRRAPVRPGPGSRYSRR